MLGPRKIKIRIRDKSQGTGGKSDPSRPVPSLDMTPEGDRDCNCQTACFICSGRKPWRERERARDRQTDRERQTGELDDKNNRLSNQRVNSKVSFEVD
jgi:hypothetical protein